MIEKKLTIYLGGKMDGRKLAECAKERNDAKALLEKNGFAFIDTLEIEGCKSLTIDCTRAGFEINEIIDRDKHYLQMADALLILTGDIPTTGTWLEFGYMKYKLEKPIVVIAPKLRKKADKGYQNWTTGEASKVVASLKEAVEWLKTLRIT